MLNNFERPNTFNLEIRMVFCEKNQRCDAENRRSISDITWMLRWNNVNEYCFVNNFKNEISKVGYCYLGSFYDNLKLLMSIPQSGLVFLTNFNLCDI